MFEKEAEEYSNNWKINKNANLNFAELVELRAVIYKAHKDGAEFGYNKANEWHRVADRDLPSEEGGWVCNQDGLLCYFDWSTEQWLDCEGTQIRTTEWCIMPHKESE